MSNKGTHDGKTNKGLWANTTVYSKDDIVKFNGWEYVSKVNNNTGVIPSADVTKWQQIRQTQKTSFINNNNTNVIDGHTVKEKQSLSQALRPKADE
jgi:hypothetical protein